MREGKGEEKKKPKREKGMVADFMKRSRF